jgi:hypothetical protein
MENEKMELPEQEVKKEFVQGEKTATAEKALVLMRELYEKYQITTDPKERIDLNLYEFPKMMEAIWEVEVENLSHPESPFLIEKEAEYRKLRDANLITKEHIERQKELALEETTKEQ